MNAERWKKVKNILEDVIEVAPNSRAAFLEKVCANDADLRGEVEKLLEFESAESDFLEQDAVAHLFENESFSKNQIGQQIGNYKITGELGSGGMGAVFLAERADGEFTQKAALKLIKRGMDSDAVLRRFLNERQILAALEHPNIARLVDGGTTRDGLPFFVMEFVEGRNVLDYADAENLDLDERLNLFREICAAVAYAHRNLVIHRDLKPSNILVTGDGTPKLLDFGIAKLLRSDAAAETGTQMQVFTPDYASPEQVRGEKLTTATDVYSLGVILYELLTGRRPYRTDSKNIGEIIKAVCETEPKPPSAAIWDFGFRISDLYVQNKSETNQTEKQNNQTNPKSQIRNPKSLRGDLDNIILKALRKEPERRYSSVEQLADDLRRHQTGLPVTASKDTWRYRITKFVARNRAAVAAVALLILALVGGVVGTSWQAIRAERMRREAETERARAERRFENLRAISNSLVSEIERAIRDLPGSLPARKLLLDRAVEQLDALAADSDGHTDLQLELAWAYQNLGWMPDGKLSERRKIYEKAAALTEKVLAAEPQNNKARDRLAMIYLDLINLARMRGDVEYTLEYNRRAVEIVEQILRDAPATPEFRDSFWTVYYHYALTEQQLGQAAESVATARKILPAAEEMYRSGSETDGYDFMKPHLTRLQIGYGLSYAGDYPAALKEFETALAECRAEAGTRPDNTILRRNEANIRLQMAAALEFSGAAGDALEQVKIAAAIRERMAADNPKDLDFQIAVADAELLLGQMLARQNQPQTVEKRVRRALETYEKIAAIDADRLQVKILAARARANLGNFLASEGNLSEGLRHLREAVRFYETNGAATTPDAGLKRHYAEALGQLAAALVKNKPPLTEAREVYRKSLELWQDLESRGVLKASDAAQAGEVSRRLSELGKTR
jgi:eukaryotic-like serine/threonine-protein kinase